MTTIKKWFANPKVRLGARAILAGVAVAFTHLKGGNLTHGAIEGALVAAGWAAVEAFTPLNGVLGLFKQAAAIDPALAKYGPTVGSYSTTALLQEQPKITTTLAPAPPAVPPGTTPPAA